MSNFLNNTTDLQKILDVINSTELVPENIKSGVSIFGVTGTLVTQTYYYGADEPSADLGVDGDIYFVMG